MGQEKYLCSDYFAADYFDYIKAGNPFDICYSIVENYYRGNSTLQLRIKDIKEREEFI